MIQLDDFLTSEDMKKVIASADTITAELFLLKVKELLLSNMETRKNFGNNGLTNSVYIEFALSLSQKKVVADFLREKGFWICSSVVHDDFDPDCDNESSEHWNIGW